MSLARLQPSRTAILIGRRPSTTGIYQNQWWRPALPDAVSMPSYFKRNGYTTMGGGKVPHHNLGHNPPDQWAAYRLQAYDELWETQDRMEAALRPVEHRTPTPAQFPLNGLTNDLFETLKLKPLRVSTGARSRNRTLSWATGR